MPGGEVGAAFGGGGFVVLGPGLVVQWRVAEGGDHRVGAQVKQTQRFAGLLFGEPLDAFAELLLGGHRLGER